MNYYKRHWDETTGDPLTDNWGTPTYYFEIGEDNYPVRQIEVYENGNTLKYDTNIMNDRYGGLGDQPVDVEDFEEFKIDKDEFEKVWTTTQRQL